MSSASAAGYCAYNPVAIFQQNLFNQIDSDGSITRSEPERAVAAAGGNTQAADAFYAKLDPNNTGSVSEQQFAQTLSQAKPHHHHDDGGQGDASRASQY
jgi:hypothetical protein